MGEFILLTAQAKAEAAHVTAHGCVRHGQVIHQVITLCLEVDANYVVLGRPQSQRGKNIFTDTHFQQFVDRILQETKAQVVFASGEPK
jgi:hypothetical protein